MTSLHSLDYVHGGVAAVECAVLADDVTGKSALNPPESKYYTASYPERVVLGLCG